MKLLGIKFLLLCGAILAATGAQAAETPATMYAVADYMSVGPERGDASYLEVEKLWQRLHQKAVDAGICRGWYLNRVENGGRNDFVTVRIYDSLEKLANPWPEELVKGLYNAEEEAKMGATDKTRDLTRSELWRLEAQAMKTGNAGQSDYLIVDFMKSVPGQTGTYFDLESKLFQKIQQARVDAGHLGAWYFLNRVFPGGTASEYDFLTINIYRDKATSEKPYDEPTIRKALTEAELNKAMGIMDTRKIVRREIWHPLLRVEPAR